MRSRGELIPDALAAGDFEAALDVCESIEARCYAPFRLVLTDGRSLAVVAGDGAALDVDCGPWNGQPRFWTSSGLGDDLVETPRRTLFDEVFASNEATPAQQAFHRHRWPDRGELSVLMARPDARTVSLTTVDVDRDAVAMSYESVVNDQVTESPIEARLSLAAVSERE